jgi:hypothetical protein
VEVLASRLSCLSLGEESGQLSNRRLEQNRSGSGCEDTNLLATKSVNMRTGGLRAGNCGLGGGGRSLWNYANEEGYFSLKLRVERNIIRKVNTSTSASCPESIPRHDY